MSRSIGTSWNRQAKITPKIAPWRTFFPRSFVVENKSAEGGGTRSYNASTVPSLSAVQQNPNLVFFKNVLWSPTKKKGPYLHENIHSFTLQRDIFFSSSSSFFLVFALVSLDMRFADYCSLGRLTILEGGETCMQIGTVAKRTLCCAIFNRNFLALWPIISRYVSIYSYYYWKYELS